MTSLVGRWLLRMGPRAMPLVRLVAFPPAGAGAGWFGSWRSCLPNWVELWCVSSPGRESRYSEPPFRRLEDLVAGVLPALAHIDDVPIAFLGHSMGAIVAWESARALSAQDAPLPVHLFVSAHRAPRLPREERGEFGLPDAALVAAVEHRYGGFPSQLLQYPEVLEMALRSLRADLEALERHGVASGPPLPMAITALGAIHDPVVPVADLEPWRDETTASFVMKTFPGDHSYLASAPPEASAFVVQRLRTTLGGRADRHGSC